ncbi:class F sortase [Arthrobacter bambusae]|uniref:class F sortase n=1 Tax=Arthrobacter bambusae TaxID=1338426 RepID=UPI0027896575|nr:class F sortase [Arthrobacter bambusae]MDQ0031066.1 hypothetical protein [Arthrobacter bambusae]MDQ0098801.1 hypothetical protein [Arthrobacter bambusae]
MRHYTTGNAGRRRLVAGIAAAAGLALAVGIAGAVLAGTGSSGGGGVPDMRGNLVAPLPGATPAAAKLAAMHVVAQDDGQNFRVPAVGLDVPLGALDDVDGVITPPGFTSAYTVRNKGVTPGHAAQGTVFVVMHSLMGGGMGPGNYLIDEEHASSRVPVGAVIEVAGLEYKVTGSSAIDRGQLANRAEVWQNTPNRLVVITCLLTPGDNAPIDNMVIYATRTTT